MKSTDKFVLVLVASLALLLAGCGGGSSSNTGDDMDDMDMSGPQKTALMNAHTALQGAVNALVGEATQDEVNTAKNAATALQNAIAAATDVADSDLTMYRNALTNANNAIGTAQDLLTTQGNKEMTAMAKALKKAIDTPATSDGTAAITVTPTSIPAIDLDGAGDGTATSTALTLKKGASVGSLGSWKGTDYAGDDGTTGDDKATGKVRAYTNEGAAKSVPFTSEAGADVHSLVLNSATEADDDYTVTLDAANSNIASSSFPTTGQRTYTGNGRKFSGTFMGASGTFECTGTDACTATIDAAGAITLAGTAWNFTPSAGAMLQQKDASYLRFGWWVREDKDGPTHVGVFYDGNAGSTNLTALTETNINNANLIGEATYVGKAAGKFAVSDSLRPASDQAGHFTANAELTADFKGAGETSTLTGTIDAFRLNDGSEDPSWSVALREADFVDADDRFSGTTVWSIGDVKGEAGGNWLAQMFNDKPADGTNVPHSTAGSFRSDFGSTHSMVGAFGAEKE